MVVQLESVPAQPNLLVSFANSQSPMEDDVNLPVHLSEVRIYICSISNLESIFICLLTQYCCFCFRARYIPFHHSGSKMILAAVAWVKLSGCRCLQVRIPMFYSRVQLFAHAILMFLLAVGLPGIPDETLFDTDALAAKLEEEEDVLTGT